MESLKLIIVDDEKRVRTSLRHLITMYYPSAEIVAEASDVEEAYSEIIKHSPDVVLLDIQLSGRTGFDLLRKLVPVNFKLIFIINNNSIKTSSIIFNRSKFDISTIFYINFFFFIKIKIF